MKQVRSLIRIRLLWSTIFGMLFLGGGMAQSVEQVMRGMSYAASCAEDSTQWSLYRAVDRAINKKKGKDLNQESTKDSVLKAQKFFADLWQQFGFAVDARFDFQEFYEETEGNDLFFNIHSLRLFFDGYILPEVRYFIKLRLTRGAGNNRDNAGDAVNGAWVSFSLKNFNLTVGRQGVILAPWEYDMNYADMYSSSLVNDEIDAGGAGVTLWYTIKKQMIGVQMLNSSSVNFTDTKNSFIWTLNYTGSFWDGQFSPAISFSLVNNAARKGLFFATVGLKYEQGPWKAFIDYYEGQYIETTQFPQKIADTTVSHYVHDRSLTATVEYQFKPQWKAILKGTLDMRDSKLLGMRILNCYGFSAAVEYTPFKNVPLRAHAAFAYTHAQYLIPQTVNFKGSRKIGIDEISAYIGFRWYFQLK